ncbi:MAG: ornithine carbamoyltransferase [Candidatus Nanopelagicaceae bacterium]
MKDLLKTEHLSRADVELLFETAARFAKDPTSAAETLAHKSVAVYMSKPSTRTRLATETAVAHLGGTPIFLRSDELQIGRGETIADTAKVISQFCSALLIRTYAQSEVDELGANASIPVINGLTDYDHPTQALADWITIREKFGKDISGRKFVYLGDGNNVTTAWLMMGAIMGAHVVAATPSGKWAPDTKVVETAKKIAQANGGAVEVTHDPIAAAKDAAVLYTDVWMSMGDPESERKEKEIALAPFKITEKLMATAASDSIFMHCLPAHRGEEVEAAVIDGPRSVIWREAFHRRTTIQSIIFHLVRGELKG